VSAADVCQEILRRREEALSRSISAYPRTQPIASDLGPCTREMVLAITSWQSRPLPSVDLKARFNRGSAIEDMVLRELSDLGISVRVERLPFEVKDTVGRLILRGKIDGFVSWERKDYPMEVKSLDPNVFRQVDTVEDFNRWTWASKYPRQLQAYLYANNLEEGFFLLDDCEGHWKLLPVTLDYAEMEKVLRQCEQAVEHRDAGTFPEYHEDPAVCRKCWAFNRVCTPPADFHGLSMMTDPDFELLLDRRGELEPSKREFDKVDKIVKERVKDQDGLVVGQWLIQGKKGHRDGYTVNPVDFWVTKIIKAEV
jgi:hypothetical protein